MLWSVPLAGPPRPSLVPISFHLRKQANLLEVHHSAESRMSVNRLRCRLRHQTPTHQMTKTIPIPALVKDQIPVADNAIAPKAPAETIIPIKNLIL